MTVSLMASKKGFLTAVVMAVPMVLLMAGRTAVPKAFEKAVLMALPTVHSTDARTAYLRAG